MSSICSRRSTLSGLPERLILLDILVRLNPANPNIGRVVSPTQDGLASFGRVVHVFGLLTKVVTRTLEAVWFQKRVYRRLRPETFGYKFTIM
jgi:hypothetical protein